MLTGGIVAFDGTVCRIPPRSIDYSFEEIESVNKTEAGTDMATITRLNKHVFSISWEDADSAFLDWLEPFSRSAMTALTWRGAEYTCRIRNFKAQMVSRSEAYGGSDGLWNISLKATEV